MQPHSSLHFALGLAVAAVALGGLTFLHHAARRRRLRHALVLAVAFAGVHLAIDYSTRVQQWAEFGRVQQAEWLLLAFALVNVLVAVLFNPWVGRTQDRAPAIVQDTLVVVGLGVFAA